MKANTRLFGEIDIQEDKIVTLEQGIIGFPELKKFTLIYDSEKGDDSDTIMWFQSLVKPFYNPTVNDELLEPLGKLGPDNLYVLVTVKVPADIKNMTVNLKAPLIINTDNMKGAQIIVENDDYDVRFPIYDILKKAKEAGE